MMDPRKTEKKVQQNMSVLNPVDAAVMKQDGAMGNPGEQTVMDALQKLGIDPQGPATQLVEWAKSQMKNANPANKMRAISGGGAKRPPREKPSMESLLGKGEY
jgi:hypothetical protein